MTLICLEFFTWKKYNWMKLLHDWSIPLRCPSCGGCRFKVRPSHNSILQIKRREVVITDMFLNVCPIQKTLQVLCFSVGETILYLVVVFQSMFWILLVLTVQGCLSHVHVAVTCLVLICHATSSTLFWDKISNFKVWIFGWTNLSHSIDNNSG